MAARQIIAIEGLDEVVRELKRRGANVADGLEAICKAGAEVIHADAAGRAPGDIGERLLVKTIQKRPKQVTVGIGPSKRDKIARFVEDGTKPHDIPKARKGRRRKPLYINGSFVMVAHHPGARPKPYLRPAYEAKKNDAQDAMGKATGKALEV